LPSIRRTNDISGDVVEVMPSLSYRGQRAPRQGSTLTSGKSYAPLFTLKAGCRRRPIASFTRTCTSISASQGAGRPPAAQPCLTSTLTPRRVRQRRAACHHANISRLQNFTDAMLDRWDGVGRATDEISRRRGDRSAGVITLFCCDSARPWPSAGR
jgi:hypothetical protein